MSGLWGKKIGMTQVFSNTRVIPVTVIDTSAWYVTGVKTVERDGYNALTVGRTRKRYATKTFSEAWLKKPALYFLHRREIKLDKPLEGIVVGQPAPILVQKGNKVTVGGLTIGRGFQGVVKRHEFAGGPSSHGSMFHRRPGTMSFMRSRGRVIKGKKLPGHMGQQQRVMRNIEIIDIQPEHNIVLIKGSVPGKAGTLIFLRERVNHG